MDLVRQNSKYAQNKKKVMDDHIMDDLHERDSFSSMDSDTADPQLATKETLSHVEVPSLSLKEDSVKASFTAFKKKTPTVKTVCSKRRIFSFDEDDLQKDGSSQQSRDSDSGSPTPIFGYLSKMLSCFGSKSA